MTGIERLRLKLESAATVAEVKDLHDQACGIACEAAAARNLALLDEAVAITFSCERKGGAMLLDGAAGVRGIDGKRWRRIARMDDESFSHALRRAQAWRRSRARPPAPKAVSTGEHGAPQARTVVSDWCVDAGFPTRFVVGVDLKRYRKMIAAGRDTKQVEAELIAEQLENSNSR